MEERKLLNEHLTHDTLKNLDFDELATLSSEIRDFLIESVSKTGGHLSSNLGVVELTLMLHRQFDFENNDRLIFDVGYQSYVHKILTGRMGAFSSLRQTDGLSGFPRRSESPADVVDTGHSGTAISVAAGIAAAKKLRGEEGTAVAVVGDGAMTGGLCYEALNNIGDRKMLIVLNDNGMSISESVGALSRVLMRVRTSGKYARAKKNVKEALHGMKKGSALEQKIRRLRDRMKLFMLPNTLMENFGIKYFGPIDGHDLRQIDFYLKRAARTEGPVVLHVKTVKGKGYSHAEQQPDRFHGVSEFDVENGVTHSLKESYSQVVGMTLAQLAAKHEDLAVVCPAMTKGCGLSGVAESFPDRFFDCGIAEEHAVTFAAGLAADGMVPVVCTYSTFLQRSYDELWHDAAMNGFHIVFCLDRAGLPGSDGKSHQGIYDLSYLSNIPGMAVLSPSSAKELEEMLVYAVEEHNGPIAIRYPKGKAQNGTGAPFVFGKASAARTGTDVTVCAEGLMLPYVLAAAEKAAECGVSAEVIGLSTVSPPDVDTVISSVRKTGKLLTVEANVRRGGLGEAIFSHISAEGEIAAFPDAFIEHGATGELMERYGLSVSALSEKIIALGGRHEA